MKIIIICKRWVALTTCVPLVLLCWQSCLSLCVMEGLVKCPQGAQDIRQLMFANVQPNNDQSRQMWVCCPQSYPSGKVHSPSRNGRVKSLKISLWDSATPLSLAPTRHFLRTDLFLAKQPESFSHGRPQGISVETGWLIKIGCFQGELLGAACSSKVILGFVRKSYTTHPIINNVLWTNCVISIWNTQRYWGRLLTNFPQFQCGRTNVITGKYSAIL